MLVKDLFDAFLIYSKNNNRSPHTINGYERIRDVLMKHLGEIRLHELTLVDCDKIREECRLRGSYQERHGCITLRRYLSFLTKRGFQLRFDWRDIDLPPRHERIAEFYTKEEVEKIRNCLNDNSNRYWKRQTYSKLRTRAIFELVLHTGLRVGEICPLKWSDVNMADEELRFNGKTHKEHIISIHGATEWLKRMKEYTEEHEYIFLAGKDFGKGYKDEPIRPNSLKKSSVILSRQLGWKFKWHAVRKTYVTWLLLYAKVDIRTTQYLARHRSPHTTLKYYAAVDRAFAKEAHKKAMDSYKG